MENTANSNISKDLEELVRTWQTPMYNLAYRMLGNQADAADAVQEIFSTLFKNLHRYDPGREFSPWIYRLGTNVLLNYIREAKTRKRKEQDIAMREEPFTENIQPENKEIEELIQENLNKLPEAQRSLVVLHYYQNLSLKQIGESLGIPKTTAHARLQKAMQSLKSCLTASGCLAVLPQIETIMRTVKTLEVPVSLKLTLLNLSSAAAPTATGVGAGSIIGGFIMAKKILLPLIMTGLVSLGIGMLSGKMIFQEPSNNTKFAQTISSSAAQEAYAALLAENEVLLGKIQHLQTEVDELHSSHNARHAVMPPAEEQLDSAVMDTDETNSHPAKMSMGWEKLSAILAKVMDSNLVEKIEDPKNQLTPEEQETFVEFATTFMQVARQAKEVSEFPFFDEEIMPKYMLAMFDKPLGLSESQRKLLMGSSLEALKKFRTVPEMENALPMERYLVRVKIVHEVSGTLFASLNAEQQPKVKPLWKLLNNLTYGADKTVTFGWKSFQENSVLEHWQAVFEFENQEVLRPIAAVFIQEGKNLLRNHGIDGEKAAALDEEQRSQIRLEFLELQVKLENQIKSLLTEKQLLALMKKYPVVIWLDPEADPNTTNSFTNAQVGF